MVQGSERNYYELLGLERNATKQMIQDAYREIARVYHPDSDFYSEIVTEAPKPEHEQLFQMMTEAYNTLCDDDRRAAYDETLASNLRTWEDPTIRATPDTASEDDARQRRITAGFRTRDYVFGSVRKTSVLDAAFVQDMRSVSVMMQRKKRFREQLLVGLATAIPFLIVLAGIILWYLLQHS